MPLRPTLLDRADGVVVGDYSSRLLGRLVKQRRGRQLEYCWRHVTATVVALDRHQRPRMVKPAEPPRPVHRSARKSIAGAGWGALCAAGFRFGGWGAARASLKTCPKMVSAP
jgi:hypothetical protein